MERKSLGQLLCFHIPLLQLAPHTAILLFYFSRKLFQFSVVKLIGAILLEYLVFRPHTVPMSYPTKTFISQGQSVQQ